MNKGSHCSISLPVFEVVSVLHFSILVHCVRWYLFILTCNSLMIHDVEYISICLFAAYISSLMRYLFRPIVHFYKACSFLFLSYRNSLLILGNNF